MATKPGEVNGGQLVERAGGTVLVGVDESDTASNALAYAIGVARRQHARLLLVHVEPYEHYRFDFTGRMLALPPVAQDTSWLAEMAGRLTAELDIDVQTVVCHGDPCHKLLDQARREWADLIIVGKSHSIAHRLLGALGPKLQRRAQVPVTVVP